MPLLSISLIQFLQVYQITTNQFLCRNKFFGRSLHVSGFQQALRQFLHNGSRLRTDVLAPLIRRLEELVGILTQQESVRFYTTSLLLIYDGLDLSCGEVQLLDNLIVNKISLI